MTDDPTKDKKGKVIKFPDVSKKAGKTLKDLQDDSDEGLLSASQEYILLPESILTSFHTIGLAVKEVKELHEELAKELSVLNNVVIPALKRLNQSQADYALVLLSALQDALGVLIRQNQERSPEEQ